MFSKHSRAILKNADPKLQEVLNHAIKEFDFSVICSTRNEADQEAAFKAKASRAHFGQSPHNYIPSLAVDIIPFPCDWKDIKKFKEMAACVLKIAGRLHIDLEWGGSWKLKDFPHMQLKNWKELKKDRKLV